MNIEEAMKRATPGPFRADCMYLVADRDGRVLAIADCGAGGPITIHQWAYNTALLAHWHKHGPKLLEALKELTDIVEGHVNDGDKLDSFSAQPQRLAIERASEVEGI